MNSVFLSVLTAITLCSTTVYSFSRPFKKKSYKLNSKISENKIISVSPGGIKGLYYLGSLFYIKEKYKLDEYCYLGSSVGSWISLFMCFKGNDELFVNSILNLNYNQSLASAEKTMKRSILENYTSSDFELNKLKIGVAEFGKYNKFNLRYTIYDSFYDLEDAIDCCIASSHVPFIIGGGVFKKYKKKLVFDGGLKKVSYEKPTNSVLHISSKVWNNEKYMKMPGLKKYKDFEVESLFNDGVNDAEKNSEYLNSIFIPKNSI